MTKAEPSRLETLVIDARDLTDRELLIAALIARQIAAGRIPDAPRRVCTLFGALDSEIGKLIDFRDEYFAHWDGLLDDDDGPVRHFRVPCGSGWPG